jgi:hypothetical protein
VRAPIQFGKRQLGTRRPVESSETTVRESPGDSSARMDLGSIVQGEAIPMGANRRLVLVGIGFPEPRYGCEGIWEPCSLHH